MRNIERSAEGARSAAQGFKKSRAGKILGYTDAVTSARMAGVRRAATKPEVEVRIQARALGLHYRTSNRDLPGSPDLANRSRSWAIFVHGCFWHRHTGCPRTTTPRNNRAFWANKFEANVLRDERAISALKRLRFRTVVIWECEASDPVIVRRKLRRLTSRVRKA
jgi:DNA mismatch endonuclease (patch repair protein)